MASLTAFRAELGWQKGITFNRVILLSLRKNTIPLRVAMGFNSDMDLLSGRVPRNFHKASLFY